VQLRVCELNYLDHQDTLWKCRNCGKVLSGDFPRLLESTLALQQACCFVQAAYHGKK
jgi:hypothetical protein